jgi:hypothetical protein
MPINFRVAVIATVCVHVDCTYLEGGGTPPRVEEEQEDDGAAGRGEGDNDRTMMTIGMVSGTMAEMGWQNGRRGCCPLFVAIGGGTDGH